MVSKCAINQAMLLVNWMEISTEMLSEYGRDGFDKMMIKLKYFLPEILNSRKWIRKYRT